MLHAIALFVAVVASFLAPAAIWLLITGRNLPGILGRGLTKGDNQRLKRAPSIYFRALGALLGMSAAEVNVLVWMLVSFLAAPSVKAAEILALVMALLLPPMGAALVWVFVLASRYRLFRWDKP